MQENALFIEEFERIIERLNEEHKPYWSVKEEQVNRTLFMAYYESRKAGKSRIDLDNAIWDRDVKPIIETLRRLGIREFTISVSISNIIELLMAFEELGAKIQGVVKVQTNTPNPYVRESFISIPAILLTIM